MTSLDNQLQEIAQKNWPQFVSLIGEDKILKAKICLLRVNGFTLTQIEKKLDVSRNEARYDGCLICPEK